SHSSFESERLTDVNDFRPRLSRRPLGQHGRIEVRRNLCPGTGVLPQRVSGHSFDVDAVEKPVKLFGRQMRHGVTAIWPVKPVFFQATQDQDEAGPIKKQKLHPIPAPIAESKYRPLEWIEAHRLLDQHRQAVDPGAEVDGIAMKINPHISRQTEHCPKLRSWQPSWTRRSDPPTA